LFATKNAGCLGRGRHYVPANRVVHPPPRLVRLGFSGFLDALLISTTDFGWSLRGVVNTKPGGHVVRAQSSSTVFSKTPMSGAL
jgi:hypothetical protein